MALAEAVLAEFTHEAETTGKMLDRLPDGRGEWRPHEKSMSLGRLAMHLAEIPGYFTAILDADELTGGGTREPRIARSSAEARSVFDASVAAFTASLRGTADARLLETWRFKVEGRVVLELPRIAAVRAMVLSHSVHHRGQLSVYLRLLDVPVPGCYGPSADDKARV